MLIFFLLPNFVEETKTQRRRRIFLRSQNCSFQSAVTLQIPNFHQNCAYENFHLCCRCLASPTMANFHTRFQKDIPISYLCPNRLTFYFQLQILLFCLARGSELTTCLLDRLFIYSFILSLTKLLGDTNKPTFHPIFVKYSLNLHRLLCLFFIKKCQKFLRAILSSSCRQVSVIVLVPDNLGQGDLIQFPVGKGICFPVKDIKIYSGKGFLISGTENSLVSQPVTTCSRGVCDV